ncbi:MAG TPA: hypothetical protein VHS09_12095, partial [Polyangiaceae bacterium]|nr:hypothetical protein [Polyangiaceae bacterium]
MKAALPVVVVLAAAFAVSTLGCKRLAEKAAEKAEEKAIEKGTGGQVSINGQKGTLTIVTDAGEMMLGGTATIPADFPKGDVPVYPGATPVLSAKQADPKGKEVWTLSLETPDPTAKVTDYYKANMSAFTLASTMDNVGSSAMRVYQNARYQVTLMVGA